MASVAKVKQGGVWVPFDEGKMRVRDTTTQDSSRWVRPIAIRVKQGGVWVRVVLPWG